MKPLVAHSDAHPIGDQKVIGLITSVLRSMWARRKEGDLQKIKLQV